MEFSKTPSIKQKIKFLKIKNVFHFQKRKKFLEQEKKREKFSEQIFFLRTKN